ncbi:MAG: hypothetical protein PWR27_1365 [Petroclostridium sp.]|jgi:hypothetical protein|nr:hypothetical protein [Petroclostridium sp.]
MCEFPGKYDSIYYVKKSKIRKYYNRNDKEITLEK